MLKLEIDQDKCTRCGLCAQDCPVRIIDMQAGTPAIAPDQEIACFKCQHCLAVCPTGALAILGRKPEESRPLEGNLPDPVQLETLIKGRRSVRHYKDENLEPELLQRLLDVAWQAPTGHNARQVRFSLIDNKEAMARFRERTMATLAQVVRENRLPAGLEFFAEFVALWEKQGVDTVFRGAPHLLVASAPRDCASPLPDCLIALSYFELYAQSLGIGTVWDGIAKWAINDLAPELRQTLGIPDDHLIGYVMAFGKPAVRYQRTVVNGPANVVRVNL